MLHGYLLYQFPQLALSGLVFHVIGLFKESRVYPFPNLPLEAQALSGDDHFASLIVHYAENIVVDDLFDAQILCLLSKKQTSPIWASAQNTHKYTQTELVKPSEPVTFQHEIIYMIALSRKEVKRGLRCKIRFC